MTAAALRRIAGWVDARTGLSGSRHLLDAKVVPRHRYSVFYYLGGMALFLFVVQVVTGLLLLLYYEPGKCRLIPADLDLFELSDEVSL